MAAPTAPGSEHDLSPEHKAILNEVRGNFDLSEKLHKQYRPRWDRFYGLYRSHRQLVRAFADSSERDRDDIMQDAKREFGQELFIPYAFATIETIVPRVLANDPQMIVKPKTPEASEFVEIYRDLIHAQQSEIDYELVLQPSARRGHMFGLGVQKTFWDRQTKQRNQTDRGVFGRRIRKSVTEVIREGPGAEDVDNYDFFWDPAAKNIKTCDYAIHRTWRTFRYIKRKIESGEWLPLDLEKVQGMAPYSNRSDLWRERFTAQNIQTIEENEGRVHEVWEYHDGEKMHVILDGTLVAFTVEKPFDHAELPFQIYRPTPIPGEFVGMGEIEQIENLQEELNTMRTQRLDNASLIVQRPIFYRAELIEEEELVFAPGATIPVNTDPSEAIYTIPWQELPASSYNEEAALKSDIELTTGISDPVAGGEGTTAATETATGIQLIQAAANIRIRLKTKNLEREMVKPAARQWKWLNRQHLLEAKTVRVDDPSQPEGYRFEQVSPEAHAADLEILPESGSTEPENEPAKRSDALAIYNQLSGNQHIDQRRSAVHLLQEFSVPDAESWLTPERVQVDAELMVATLQNLGVDGQQAQQYVQQAVAIQQAAEQGQPGSSSGAPLESDEQAAANQPS